MEMLDSEAEYGIQIVTVCECAKRQSNKNWLKVHGYVKFQS